MPLKISRQIRNELPSDEKAALETTLQSRPQECYLCGCEYKRESDDLECDHIMPRAQGGETTLDNLCVVHKSCNRFKQDLPMDLVRPFLTFQSKTKSPLYLDSALSHFKLNPHTPNYNYKLDKISLSVDDIESQGKIFKEPYGKTSYRAKNNKEEYRFCYLELPFDWIQNDDEVQPRMIYYKHVWNIYKDLSKNPLHEAPCLRLKPIDSNTCKLLMFDGQHKTISALLSGYKKLVFKLYLDLEKEEANILVNSIQDQLTKQGLNIVESANKFASEFDSQWNDYKQKVGEENASESGFTKDLPKTDRPRAKKALKAQLQKEFFNDPEISELSKWLTDKKASGKITKKAFTDKFLMKLIDPSARDTKGLERTTERHRERINIIKISNFMFKEYWEEADDDTHPRRAARLRMQVGLETTANMFRNYFRMKNGGADNDKEVFLVTALEDADFNVIKQQARKYFNHPFWDSLRDNIHKPKIAEACNHLERNEYQKFMNYRHSLGIGFGYGLGIDELNKHWGE